MNDDSKVNIEIDGVALQALKGATIIDVADQAGIRIPRFCYHQKLSVAANCRMCLVEVEKSPKPLPACATPVMEGMKVFTRSPKAIDAQKGTMEFLLINHPLDCPVCDQGGECELQDVAVGYGGDVSRYSEGKRVVQDQDIGPLIATDMTRCIHCTRCVRFGIEIAGIQELGATGRGESTRIGTYVEGAVSSEISGNVIDLCPVGALTAKPSHMTARAWELRRHAAIASHDCVGSNIFVHTWRGDVNRVVPRDNEVINECWIADRDRFSYQGLKSDARLRIPMIKRDGAWQECDWDTALEAAVKGLQKLLAEQGGEQLGMLVSPSATLEEMALLQRLAQGLGCANLDHRLRQSDFSDQDAAPPFPWLGQSIEDLEQLDAALLIGSDVRREQPLVAHRLRKAAKRGGRLMFVNNRDFDFHYQTAENILCSPDGMVLALAGITKALLEGSGTTAPDTARKLLQAVEVSDAQAAIAARLKSSSKACVLLGTQALAHPALASLRALVGIIAEVAGAAVGYLSGGANASGAWLAGVLPHRVPGGEALDRAGLSARAMLESPRKGYLLHAVEPEYDCQDPRTALAALKAADFVVALTPFVGETMKDYADVLLPTAPFAETSGTFVNVEGRWQSFTGATGPRGQARPAWKVLRVMGNLLDLDGFEYLSSEEVRDELKGIIGEVRGDNRVTASAALPIPGPEEGAIRISGVSMYAVDGLTRRSAPLQQTAEGSDTALRIGSDLARKLDLEKAQRVLVTQGKARTGMAVVIDDGIADGCVWIPAGADASAQLGPMYGPIELEAD